MIYLQSLNRRTSVEATGELDGKTLPGCPLKYFSALIMLYALLISEVCGQGISVSGRITSGRIPIQYASVTFVDNADTTVKYTSVTDISGYYRIDHITSVGSEASHLPSTFELGQNYPNPFSSSTAIPYNLGEKSAIQVMIYDILGREVRHFSVGNQAAGTYNILWDGRSNAGHELASGVYFYQLRSQSESVVKKLILNHAGSSPMKIPGLRLLTPTSPAKRIDKTWKVGGSDFAIRIENTSTTTPLIVPQEIQNVTIQSDTTINVSGVTYIPVAICNSDSVHQVVRGYGAASPWYLPVATDSEIQSAFGTYDGQIGLSIYRITVEADSTLWGKWVSSTKKAKEMGAIIIASPWYAPGDLTETRDGEVRIKLDKYDEYAAHLSSFVQFMEQNGVPIYGLSVQNEPEMGDWTNWSPGEMFTFVKDYAGTIQGTYVMAPEVSNFGRSYSDPLLNDSTACANTDIVCGHIYGGGLLKYPLAEEKGKEVWMTEYLMGENNSGNNMSWAMELAKNINDVMKADMNAYVWWTMVRYYGPIGDGTTASDPADPDERYPAKGEVTKKGYVLSQFSRFIRPGYYRVDATVYPFYGNPSVTAYRDPSSSRIVIVAVNSGSVAVEHAFRIENKTLTSPLSPYTTSESKNCERGDTVHAIDGTYRYTLEPLSITTFVSQ